MNSTSHYPIKGTLSLYSAIGLFALVLVMLMFAAGLNGAPQQASDAPATRVETDTLHIQEGFVTSVYVYGLVESPNASDLSFDSAGQVTAIFNEEGDWVEKGAVMATLDAERLRARQVELEASLARANADLALANMTLSRVKSLVDKKLISSQQLDEANASQASAQAQVEEINATLASLAVDSDKTRLLAPFSGTVSARYVDEGGVLAAGAPLFTLTSKQAYQIRLAVPADMLSIFALGEMVSVEFENGQLNGKVLQHLPIRNRQPRTIDVLVSVNADDGLRPGDMAKVRGEKRHAETGAWLPVGALSNGLRGLWRVFVVNPQTQTLEGRAVEVLYTNGERAFVRGAIRDQQQFVISGTHKLSPGQTVRVSSSSPITTGAGQ